jgi:hypothetical protein
VVKEGGVRSNRIYVIIAFFLIVIVVFAVVFGTSKLTPAYVPDGLLNGGWSENIADRAGGSQLIGLEKWCSSTYEMDGQYPAYLTITTFKTLIMMSEKDLRDKTTSTIEKALAQGITIDNASEITGERTLNNKHKTTYILYNGSDTTKNPPEKIKIIGEFWNCGTSGTSIICIGFAQVTDYAHGSSTVNTTQWAKIIKDKNGLENFTGEDGLIYGVVCH